MIEQVAAGQELSAEVIEQIRVKTDGVPLFVEELTKSVMESVGSMQSMGHRTPNRSPTAGDSRDIAGSAAGAAGSLVHCAAGGATGSDVGARVLV